MMRRIAHERAAQVMANVDVTVDCPSCGEDILCTVSGIDVEVVHWCVNGCQRETHFDRDALDGAAVALALGEREGYARHLLEYER